MKLIVIGAGGHASVVLDVVRLAIPDVEIVGLLDDAVPSRTQVLGSKVLGRISDIGRFPHDAVALAVGDNDARARIFEDLRRGGETFPTLVHPSATIAASATLGAGTLVLAHAVVNAAAQVADNVIVNTAATVDHHTVVEAHVHIAPGVHIAGGCRIGERTAIGIGTVVAPGLTIGPRTMVGAGSVVVRDLAADVVAFGTPAAAVRSRAPRDSFD